MHSGRARCRSRHLQPQHGDGGAAHAGGALAGEVSDVAASTPTRETTFVPRPRDRDKKWNHARPRRNRAGDFSDDGRFARSRVPGLDDGPVSASNAESFASTRIRYTGTIRSLRRDRAKKRIRARRVRSARAQLLSRGRLSSGCPLRMEASKTAAVIPAYNEEKHIGDVVRRTRQKLDDVLVVDDGSREKTAKRRAERGGEGG